MRKQEEIYDIKSDLIDEKFEAPVKSNRKKYIIAIIAAATLISALSILLIGHFKFNWFQSEIYKLDATINRASYQANYFSETKNMKAAFTFSNGNHVEKDAKITTNFLVYLLDKQKIKNTFINTASLIILNSHVKSDETDQDLTSFKLFDESTLKEVENNPDGSKYPNAIFSFTEEGTIKEIQLPNNMDKFNADSIVELIGNVVPKLTRNRTEDMSNGIEIKEAKNNKVKTIIETQAPREYPSFKGSKYSKKVERDIENEEITKIRVIGDAFFQTEEQVDDNSDLGMRDFLYKINSEIISVKSLEDKANAELIKKITEKFNYIKSEELIKNILQKEKEEKEIPDKSEEIEEKEEVEETAPLRQLGKNIKKDIAQKEQERKRKQEEERRRKQEQERKRKQEEERRRKQEEERKRKQEQERKRKQEEERRKKQEQERKRKQEEERKRKQEEERKRKQEEERRKKLEQERKKKQEEERKRKQEEERKRKQEEERKRKQEEERKRKQEEEKKKRQEEERKKKQEEERKKKQEEEKKKRLEEIKKKKQEEERKRKQEEERKRKQEEEKKKKKQEEERKKKQDEEKKKKQEEERRKKIEEEKKKRLEEIKKKREEEEKKKKQEEEKKRKQEEEKKKKKQEEEKKKKQEEEKKKKKQEEEKKKKQEEERKKKLEEEKKKKQEEEKKKKQDPSKLNIESTYTIKTIQFLGQSLTIKYRVGLKNGKAINLLIISSKTGEAKFGNNGEGIIGSTSKKLWSGKHQIFSFPFPPFPAITLAIYAGGSIDTSVTVNFSQVNIKFELTGTLTASAEIKAGLDKALSFSAGAEGTVISASGFVEHSMGGFKPGYKISGGKIVAYVVARALGKEVWKLTHTIFGGW